MAHQVEWDLPSEDYEEMTDHSSLTVEGGKVRARCNDVEAEYELAGPPVSDGSEFAYDWPVDPTDRRLVDELCQKAFGVGLAQP